MAFVFDKADPAPSAFKSNLNVLIGNRVGSLVFLYYFAIGLGKFQKNNNFQ
jgi:hypothetical protein